MTYLTFDVRDSGVQAALDSLSSKVGNMQPILKTIGEDIMARAKLRFKTSTGPDGNRWLPNARSTIEEYIRRQGGFGKQGINKKGRTLAVAKRPLIGESKSLMSQFHVNATAGSLTVSNSMVYAAIQQFGGQSGRGKRIQIPARPFLPLRRDGGLHQVEKGQVLALLNGYSMAT